MVVVVDYFVMFKLPVMIMMIFEMPGLIMLIFQMPVMIMVIYELSVFDWGTIYETGLIKRRKRLCRE